MTAQSHALFVSHTTRDERDSALAHQLADALDNQGVKVWIAPESIPPGDRWEEALVAAIMERCTHFLIVLSESSIHSDWVLKEIALIRQRSSREPIVKVLPLRVGKIGSFAGEEFLAPFQKLPYHDQFAAQLRSLLDALGLPPPLPALFRQTIAETTKDFVGRGEVFVALQKFLSAEKKGTFLLLGEPGQGKTTILSEYVRRTGCPAHFNISPAGIDTTAKCFESIKSQLGLNFGARIQARAGECPSVAMQLAELLERAARARPQGEPLVIAIDALDEVKETNETANILELPPVLPEGVFLFLSGRPQDYRLYSRDPKFTYDMHNFPARNRQDIELFLRKRFAAQEFVPWFKAKKWSLDQAVEQLGDRSENNFMYLYYVLREIQGGNYRDPKEELPTGLQDYYNRHWHRMGMTNLSASLLKLDVLQILALIKGPVGAKLIADVLKADILAVRAILDEWRGFLHATVVDGAPRYRLYHTSFQDFLRSKEAIQDLDPSRWLGQLADYFDESPAL